MLFLMRYHYNEILKKGPVLLGNLFNKIWETNTSKIIRKLSETSKIADAKSKLLESDIFGVTLNSNFGVANPNKEYFKNWKTHLRKLVLDKEPSKIFIELFISLVEKNGIEMKNNFEAFCTQPPLSLNPYLIKLLSSILFDSESINNDKFYVEKNIRLCAS